MRRPHSAPRMRSMHNLICTKTWPKTRRSVRGPCTRDLLHLHFSVIFILRFRYIDLYRLKSVNICNAIPVYNGVASIHTTESKLHQLHLPEGEERGTTFPLTFLWNRKCRQLLGIWTTPSSPRGRGLWKQSSQIRKDNSCCCCCCCFHSNRRAPARSLMAGHCCSSHTRCFSSLLLTSYRKNAQTAKPEDARHWTTGLEPCLSSIFVRNELSCVVAHQ